MGRVTGSAGRWVDAIEAVFHVAARTGAGLKVGCEDVPRGTGLALRGVAGEAELSVGSSASSTEVLVGVEIEVIGGANGAHLLAGLTALYAVGT